jgi:3-dehydroquinate dehydratase-1
MPTQRATPRIVGVIFSRTDLRSALRLRRPPDFFELRLDALVSCLDEVETAQFPAPLILTARDPCEGGVNNLSLRARRELLLRFLPRAHTIDIELRAAPAFRSVLRTARGEKIRRIISFHSFKSTPPVSRLHEIARAAQEFGADIFKVATRTDTRTQFNRLLDFYDAARMPIAAMGIGQLGRAARRELMRRGSFLNYAHLEHSGIAGQPSLLDLRRWAMRPAVAPR